MKVYTLFILHLFIKNIYVDALCLIYTHLLIKTIYYEALCREVSSHSIQRQIYTILLIKTIYYEALSHLYTIINKNYIL